MRKPSKATWAASVLASVVGMALMSIAPEAAAPAGALATVPCAAPIPPATWSTRQIGSTGADAAAGLAVDASRCAVYVAGRAGAAVSPATSAGGTDVVLARYETTGAQRWLVQFGSPGFEWVGGVTVDAAGDVYVVGWTDDILPGSPVINFGGFDTFLLKFDPDGVLMWTRQLGGTSNDYALGVAASANGDVYVTGYTDGVLIGASAGGRDYFLARYDASGNLLMLTQRGSAADDYGTAVAAGPAGNAYVAGETFGDLAGVSAGGRDLFVAKYDDAGAELWLDQRGTSAQELAGGIAVNSTNDVFVVGSTSGALDGNVNQGFADMVLLRYDANGTWRFTRQRGSTDNDDAHGVAIGAGGGPYVVGTTSGALDGNVNAAGTADVFVMKFGKGGAWNWTRELGGNSADSGTGIAVMGNDNVFAAGGFNNTFPGLTSLGSSDILALRYDGTGALR